jgi:alkanesulfonate monooxygenase SsuD/methylene tetrahydromethanopterin reductase-like flavin-dependent oxidoreductase (luciferase family)
MRVGVWMPNAMPFGLERSFFLEWVRLADQAGFDTLSTLDRPNYDMWDPLVSLAAAAAVTERTRLATTTLPLPNRNEVLVAKQAAVIDRLSGGRLTLGVSLGSRPDDYQVFGATLAHRVTRFRRQLATIRRVWAEARQSDGEHGVLGPPPVLDPGPPIWIGALSGLGSGLSSWPTGSSSGAPPDCRRSGRRSRACARRSLSTARPG